MMRQVLAPALYRFGATFRQRRGGYLTIVLLLGLVGGTALGALAGARRTQSSYPVYLANTKPSDLQVFTAFLNPALGRAETRGYRPSTERRIAALSYVESQQTVVGFDANIDQVLGAHSRVGPGAKPPSLEGAVGTEYFTQDRMTLVSGRIPDLADPGEAVMNAEAGKELGIHVGSSITVTLNSDAQLLSPANNPPAVARASLRIVGLVVFPQDVVNDDYDAAGTAEVLVTPALTRRIDGCCATYSYSSLQVAPGHEGAVESELSQVLPSKLLAAVGFRSGAPSVGLAERAIEPESIALAVFGALAALIRTRDPQSDHRTPATHRGARARDDAGARGWTRHNGGRCDPRHGRRRGRRGVVRIGGRVLCLPALPPWSGAPRLPLFLRVGLDRARSRISRLRGDPVDDGVGTGAAHDARTSA